MAITQSDIDALEKAIATGALQVRYADGSGVTYRSQLELERALAFAKRQLPGADAGAPRSFVAEL